MIRTIVKALVVILVLATWAQASADDFKHASAAVRFAAVDIGKGVVLHYAEDGSGAPVIFVHGSLSDMSYWKDQLGAFGKHYRAIAYSRRYNWPNHNRAVAGYSAITDAQDLTHLIRALHLGRVYVVGHSYGALTALYLAIYRPQLVRAMVLAEPPAIPLLEAVKGADRARAQAMYLDIEGRMVGPMRRDFRAGNREAGVADFIDYVLNDPLAWTSKFSASDRKDTMRDAHEWDVMMTSGTLFPPISARQVKEIRVPTLVMSGGRSYPFLGIIDRYLVRQIPHARSVEYPDAGHQMWMQHPAQARSATERFFERH